MPETLTDIKNNDADFFHRVRRDPALAAVLERDDLQTHFDVNAKRLLDPTETATAS